MMLFFQLNKFNELEPECYFSGRDHKKVRHFKQMINFNWDIAYFVSVLYISEIYYKGAKASIILSEA